MIYFSWLISAKRVHNWFENTCERPARAKAPPLKLGRKRQARHAAARNHKDAHREAMIELAGYDIQPNDREYLATYQRALTQIWEQLSEAERKGY